VIVVVLGIVHDATIDVGGSELRIEPDRLAEVGQRVTVVALRIVDDATIVVTAGQLRIQPQRLIVISHRMREVAFVIIEGAAIAVAFRSLRIQPDRLVEISQRAGIVALELIRMAAIAVGKQGADGKIPAQQFCVELRPGMVKQMAGLLSARGRQDRTKWLDPDDGQPRKFL
jgi:hypothetical protein